MVQTRKAWNRGYDYLLPNPQGDLVKHCSHYLPENPHRQRSRRNPSHEHDARFSQNLSIHKSNRAYPVKAPFTQVHVYQTHKETWRNIVRTIFLKIHTANAREETPATSTTCAFLKTCLYTSQTEHIQLRHRLLKYTSTKLTRRPGETALALSS